ncbi:hypothetical protein [Kibdelosporangium aridum]|uniref:hypothetical protein n=1 Tax=Kibdelosporangium aridum TaxID=2030 RepID=UPI00117ACA83|nr:hypothetical protein [Kibdelosporangium aridum]
MIPSHQVSVYSVHGELLDLYRLSDGQLEPWRSELPGATDLFPCARFVPLADMQTGTVIAATLVAYLGRLATSALEISDDDGVLTWDVR